MAAKALQHLEASIFETALRLTSRVDIERTSDWGDRLFRKIAPLSAKYNNAVRNFRIAFPDRDEDWIGKTARAMLAALKDGTCVGLHIDRRTRFDEDLPFFGIDTPTSTIPARMALRTGAACVSARVERLPRCVFASRSTSRSRLARTTCMRLPVR